jgi:hypothetical protein
MSLNPCGWSSLAEKLTNLVAVNLQDTFGRHMELSREQAARRDSQLSGFRLPAHVINFLKVVYLSC